MMFVLFIYINYFSELVDKNIQLNAAIDRNRQYERRLMRLTSNDREQKDLIKAMRDEICILRGGGDNVTTPYNPALKPFLDANRCCI
jgi:hypothetical protein